MRRNDLTSDEVRFERLIQTLDREPPAPDAEFLRTLREASTKAFLAAQANRPQPHRGATELPPHPGRSSQLLRTLRVAMLSAVAVMLVLGFLPSSVLPSRGAALQVAFDNLRRNEAVEILVDNGAVANTLLYSHENGREKVTFRYPSGNEEVVEDGVALFVNLDHNSSHPSPTNWAENNVNNNPVGDKLMASLNVNDPQVKAMLMTQRPQSQVEQNGTRFNYYSYKSPSALYDGQTLTVDATVNATTNSLVAMNSTVTDSRGNVQFQANAAVTGVNQDIPVDRFRVAAVAQSVDNLATVEEVQGNAEVFESNLVSRNVPGGFGNDFSTSWKVDGVDSAVAANNSGGFKGGLGATGSRSASGSMGGGMSVQSAEGAAKGRQTAGLAELESVPKQSPEAEQMESVRPQRSVRLKDSAGGDKAMNRQQMARNGQSDPAAQPTAEDSTDKPKPASSKAPSAGLSPLQPKRLMAEKQLRAAQSRSETAPPAPEPAGTLSVSSNSVPAQKEGPPAPLSKSAAMSNARRAPGESNKADGVTNAPAAAAPKADADNQSDLKSSADSPSDPAPAKKMGQRFDKAQAGKPAIPGGAKQLANPAPAAPLDELKQFREEKRELARNLQTPEGLSQDFPLRQNSFQLGVRSWESGQSATNSLPYGLPPRQVEANFELRPGQLLRTGNDAPNVVRARLANDAKLYVGPGSEVLLLKPTEVQLQFGELALEVPDGDQVDLLGPDQEFPTDPENFKQNSRRQYSLRGSLLRRQVTGRGVFRVEKNQLQEVAQEPEWLTKYQANYSRQNYLKGAAKAPAKQALDASELNRSDGLQKAAAPRPAQPQK